LERGCDLPTPRILKEIFNYFVSNTHTVKSLRRAQELSELLWLVIGLVSSVTGKAGSVTANEELHRPGRTVLSSMETYLCGWMAAVGGQEKPGRNLVNKEKTPWSNSESTRWVPPLPIPPTLR